jgi:outer membrane protein assembly factor BamB
MFRHALATVASLLLALTGVAALCAEENWPEFRGPRGNGQSDATPPTIWSESSNVTWKTAIHDKGWSSPVVWNDQIWLTTATEDGKRMFALCLDRASGKIERDIELIRSENPQYADPFNSYASCSPAIEEGRVYIHFGSFGTDCLDTATGETLWSRRDLPCNHHRGMGSSPIIHGDLLIVHFDGFDYQYLVALNKHTGETVWKKDREIDYGTDNGDVKKAYGTPIVQTIDGREQLISPTAMALISYDVFTGDELWRVRFDQHSMANRPLFGESLLGEGEEGGLFFIGTGFPRAELLAVKAGGVGDITQTHVAWRQTKGVPSMPSQLLIDGHIYMVDEGVATCLDARTGEQIWQARAPGKYVASPIFAGGHIYMPNDSGQTTVFKPGLQYDPVAVNRLDEGCLASPAAVGKSLYLRTRTHLYCLE